MLGLLQKVELSTPPHGCIKAPFVPEKWLLPTCAKAHLLWNGVTAVGWVLQQAVDGGASFSAIRDALLAGMHLRGLLQHL